MVIPTKSPWLLSLKNNDFINKIIAASMKK